MQHQSVSLAGPPDVEGSHRAVQRRLPVVERLPDLGRRLVERRELAIARVEVTRLQMRTKPELAPAVHELAIAELLCSAYHPHDADGALCQVVRRPVGHEVAVRGHELR